jgi:putative flippase GtrA
MIRFIKAQTSALSATLVDFLLTIILKEVFGVWYALANTIGVIAGGLVNFYINRDWVFNGRQDTLRIQVLRYISVWCGNFLLNITGVWLLTQYTPFNYICAKIITATLVGCTYNYVLQKNFVFK